MHSNTITASYRESFRETESHHSLEKLPVTKVHLHLFLQLIQVTLRQHSAIYISLQGTERFFHLQSENNIII